MNSEQLLQTFIVESRELLESMETALLAVDSKESDPETINAIFRAAHTIKGSAGLFGLNHIVAFTHVVESVLDAVRDDMVVLDAELVTLLLACSDHIESLIGAVAAGRVEEDAGLTRQGMPLLHRLQTYLAGTAATPVAAPPPTPRIAAETPWKADATDQSDRAETDADHWHISLRFGQNVFRNGMDPLSFIRYLGRLGTIVDIVTLSNAIPSDESMDPESCYLSFEIAFKSEADKSTIDAVFEFVRDDCDIRILPPNSRISEYVRLIRELPGEPDRLGEMLLRCGTLTERELSAALNAQSQVEPPQAIGAILIEQKTVQPAVVEAALAKQKNVRDAKAQESRLIRVDADKLDHLINMVGELVIAAAATDLAARRGRMSELLEATSTLSGMVEEVRDNALQLRMVKIGGTFSRFQRVVHDVSHEIGKDIELVVSGEDTELDKAVVEKIVDPLTHLVRNSMDHGIESPEVRAERGKPAKGTVRLDAYHESGSIVIEVGDDGGGLKRDKILAKAVERGLVEPGRILSDSEIYGLIFEPGFSTAESVTRLSGRGVGMDVVKRNITALRGSVAVRSDEGVGTTVTIRLPLTLAIINGFLIGLGTSVFVVPVDMIEECVAFTAEPGHDYINLRGQVLPFIRLREQFGIEGAPAARENVVVVKHAGSRVGLVVDTLLGEFQTVIKPLGTLFNHIKCISGSTILGSGEVALILDVPALVQQAGGIASQAAKPGEAAIAA